MMKKSVHFVTVFNVSHFFKSFQKKKKKHRVFRTAAIWHRSLARGFESNCMPKFLKRTFVTNDSLVSIWQSLITTLTTVNSPWYVHAQNSPEGYPINSYLAEKQKDFHLLYMDDVRRKYSFKTANIHHNQDKWQLQRSAATCDVLSKCW